MFQKHSENPMKSRVGDCTIRAISKALGQSWDKTFVGIAMQAFCSCDMPSSNAVFGAYLKSKGYERNVVPSDCPDCYTVSDFCEDHPEGTFILALDKHVVTVIDGDYFDTWDSGDEEVIYFWVKKGD